MSSVRSATGLILTACLLAGGARAADTAPAAPASASAASPEAVAAAGTILGDIGIKQQIALVVPGMMAELERNVTTTRPEIKGSLRETLKAIQPEFDKTAIEIYDKAATILAQDLGEQDVKEVAAFFESPVGKKYVTIEPQFLQSFGALAEPWREQLSTDILARAREEMKKKGIDF